jgi:hypothetical protein
MAKLSKDLLSDEERIRAFMILSKYRDIVLDLSRYAYYEKKANTTKSPAGLFNREDTQTNLNEVGWLINKLEKFITIRYLSH